MASKKDQEDALREFIKNCPKEGISKAPPPITPLSGYGGAQYYRSTKTEPQQELFVPITGTELMQKWSVGWEGIFSFAEQDKLTPYRPERFRTCVKDDFGMLSAYSQQGREEYFSQWLYRPNKVEAFEEQHGDILNECREKYVSREYKENPNSGTIVRKEQALAVARTVRRDFPNLTAKEAALEINARLEKILMQGYSVKHLIRIIKYLKFKPGKPGNKPKK